jgi:hypothetical protein
MSKKIGLESQYAKLYPVKANIGKFIAMGIAKAVGKKPSSEFSKRAMQLSTSETPSTAKRAMSGKTVEMLTVKPTIKGKIVGEGKGAAIGTVGTGLGYYDTVINETDVESKMGGGMMNYNEGGFPDLNKDGRTTFADVLQGRLKGKKKNGKK